MIAQECIDEFARTIGQGEKVAAITAAAMRGEIDFEAALTERVALFAGVDVATVEEIVERLTPNSGAQTLVADDARPGRSYGACFRRIYSVRRAYRKAPSFRRGLRQSVGD